MVLAEEVLEAQKYSKGAIKQIFISNSERKLLNPGRKLLKLG